MPERARALRLRSDDLSKLPSVLGRIEGIHRVTLEDLFPPEVVRKRAKARDLGEFLAASPVAVGAEEPPERLSAGDRVRFEGFVRERSGGSWEELLFEAASDWVGQIFRDGRRPPRLGMAPLSRSPADREQAKSPPREPRPRPTSSGSSSDRDAWAFSLPALRSPMHPSRRAELAQLLEAFQRVHRTGDPSTWSDEHRRQWQLEVERWLSGIPRWYPAEYARQPDPLGFRRDRRGRAWVLDRGFLLHDVVLARFVGRLEPPTDDEPAAADAGAGERFLDGIEAVARSIGRGLRAAWIDASKLPRDLWLLYQYRGEEEIARAAAAGATAGGLSLGNALTIGLILEERTQAAWRDAGLEGTATEAVTRLAAETAVEIVQYLTTLKAADLALRGSKIAIVSIPVLSAIEAGTAASQAREAFALALEGELDRALVAAGFAALDAAGFAGSVRAAGRGLKTYGDALALAAENAANPSIVGSMGGNLTAPRRRKPATPEPSPAPTPADRPESRAPGGPRSPGKWEEINGERYYTPDEPERFGLKPGERVPFRNGSLDFSQWAEREFEVPNMTGKDDRSIVHRAMLDRFPNEFATRASVIDFLSVHHLAIHHLRGGARIQLIPSNLHKLSHSGGAADLRSRSSKR